LTFKLTSEESGGAWTQSASACETSSRRSGGPANTVTPPDVDAVAAGPAPASAATTI
jgi:hypothetical protein